MISIEHINFQKTTVLVIKKGYPLFFFTSFDGDAILGVDWIKLPSDKCKEDSRCLYIISFINFEKIYVFVFPGKQVSAAFDFLNNYLSDDEGTEYLGSRSHSPVPL